MSPNIHDLVESRWLKAANIAEPKVYTLTGQAEQVNMAQPGQPAQLKPVVYFAEVTQGLALNATNIKMLDALFGPDYTQWKNRQVELYTVDTTDQQGKPVKGIRLRTPAPAPFAPSAPPAPPMGPGQEATPTTPPVPPTAPPPQAPVQEDAAQPQPDPDGEVPF